jgi:hypothetical protein
LRDPQSPRRAITTLEADRKKLSRRKKAAQKGFKSFSFSDAWRINRSSQGLPDFGAHQLSQAMRDANAADQAGTLRKEQLAAIDGSIQAVDHALVSLNEYARAKQ